MANYFLNLVKETYRFKNSLFNSCDDSREDMLVLNWTGGEYLNDISIYVGVRQMDDGTILATLTCYDFQNFSNNFAQGVLACNKLNNDELVRYFIDDEGDAGSCTSILFNAYGVSSQFSPEQILIAAAMMALSADDAYAVFERARWAN